MCYTNMVSCSEFKRQSSVQSLHCGFLHGCCSYSNFSVRPACPSDRDNLANFVANLNGSTDLLLDTQRFLDAKRDPLSEGSTPLYVLVAECSGQLVGVCVMRDEEVRYSVCFMFT